MTLPQLPAAVLAAAVLCGYAAGQEERGREARVTAAEIKRGPKFPRIANCYGASVGPGAPQERIDFVARYDLLIGGFWTKWDNPEHTARLQQMLAHIKSKNPRAILLDFSSSAPYAHPDDPAFPKDGWLLTPGGDRINGWPGTFMTNLTKPEVIDWLAARSERSVRAGFDGTFIDCMAPYFDAWACEIATGRPWEADADGDGKPDERAVLDRRWKEAKQRLAEEVRKRIGRNRVFMGNQAGEDNFARVNGILFEDNLDYVLDAGAEWRKTVEDYIHWTRTPSRPTVTAIVSSSGVEPPFEAWRLSDAEKEKLLEKGRSLARR
ncbi:MAG TPA: hypothetical protein ENN09_03750, partial [Planctomycetes bacterium]|nr:hypothetical protein [Planctomycetota bacterium]